MFGRKTVLAPAVVLSALLAAQPGKAEPRDYWQERVCEFTDEAGDPSVLLQPEERQFRVAGVARETLAGIAAQTIHEFGLVIRKMEFLEDKAWIEAWRFARKKDKSATGRGIILTVEIKADADAEAAQGQRLELAARYQGIELRDPCIYNTIVARIAKNLPAGIEVSTRP